MWPKHRQLVPQGGHEPREGLRFKSLSISAPAFIKAEYKDKKGTLLLLRGNLGNLVLGAAVLVIC